MQGTRETGRRASVASAFRRQFAVAILLLGGGAAVAASVDDAGPPAADWQPDAYAAPQGVALFDLHEPGVLPAWTSFLATTPMLNEAPLPPALQKRMASVVANYRYLTPVNRPAFFVATYFDALAERLFATEVADQAILPLRVCPVFASGADATTSDLLAVASGLPDSLFADTPGHPERYRYLILETEYSHCRFLASLAATGMPADHGAQSESVSARLRFSVATQPYTATVGNRRELRALLETVGDVEAVTRFRTQMADGTSRDEADVLMYLRLISMLATDGRYGYAAIPVLFPALTGDADGGQLAERAPVSVSDALTVAYRARSAFRTIVPFRLRHPEDLLRAQFIVADALADADAAIDGPVRSLLERFVVGADILLPPRVAQQKMPLIED